MRIKDFIPFNEIQQTLEKVASTVFREGTRIAMEESKHTFQKENNINDDAVEETIRKFTRIIVEEVLATFQNENGSKIFRELFTEAVKEASSEYWTIARRETLDKFPIPVPGMAARRKRARQRAE